MHLLQVGFTLGTLLAVSQPGAAVPASSVALRRGDDVCSMPFNNGDPETAKKTWNDSGAATWFENFLKEKGVTDWSNNFFKAIIAGGTQGMPHMWSLLVSHRDNNTNMCRWLDLRLFDFECRYL